jgi:hypothetical protein
VAAVSISTNLEQYENEQHENEQYSRMIRVAIRDD